MLRNIEINVPFVIKIVKLLGFISLLIILSIVAPSILLSYLVHMPFMHSVVIWLALFAGICVIINSAIALVVVSSLVTKNFVFRNFGRRIYILINIISIILSTYVCIKFYMNIPILYGPFKLSIYCLKTVIPMFLGLALVRYLNKNLYRARRKK